MTAVEILETMKSIRENGAFFGIRKSSEVHKVGDELDCSYNWSDDEELDGTELNGTCATGFEMLWFDGEQEDIDTVQTALNINARYEGSHQYLIYGTGYEYGDDENEVILTNAEVVAVIK